MDLIKKIWIIEDMEDLEPIYRNTLKEDEFHLTFFRSFCDFASAYTKSAKDKPHLVIADIFLEDGHFFKLLNEADIALTVPYLVISSSDDFETFKNAFEAGAIDYILKPLNRNEVRAKLEKHLKDIELSNYEASKSLKLLNLNLTDFTNKECKIIESFNVRDDKILHRNEIVKIIWKNIAIHPNTLDVHIYNLRKKLKEYHYTIKSLGNGLFRFEDDIK